MVGCGCYCIVGDSLVYNSQKTILMARIVCFVVKIVKQELKVDDTFLQPSNALASSIFIELSNSSLGEDLTPLPLSIKLSKGILQFEPSLSLESSTHVGSI